MYFCREHLTVKLCCGTMPAWSPACVCRHTVATVGSLMISKSTHASIDAFHEQPGNLGLATVSDAAEYSVSGCNQHGAFWGHSHCIQQHHLLWLVPNWSLVMCYCYHCLSFAICALCCLGIQQPKIVFSKMIPAVLSCKLPLLSRLLLDRCLVLRHGTMCGTESVPGAAMCTCMHCKRDTGTCYACTVLQLAALLCSVWYLQGQSRLMAVIMYMVGNTCALIKYAKLARSERHLTSSCC